MDARESEQKFKEADTLYREGRYGEALARLDELNRAYPNAKNILYPAALCLEKLGRGDEALPICEQLIAQFHDPRARELQERLTAAQAGAGEFESTALADLGLHGAGDILDMGPPRRTYTGAAAEPDTDWKRYALIGFGVTVLVALIVIPPLMYEAPPEGTPGPTGQGQGPGMDPDDLAGLIGAGTFLILAAAAFVGNMLGGYLALSLMNQLPSDSLSDNLISLGLTVLVVSLVGFVPIVGGIIGLVIISKNYDLGCGGLLLFVFLAGMGSALCIALPLMLLVGSLAALAPPVP